MGTELTRFSGSDAREALPNPYQADDVKRTDECPTGTGWPSEKLIVSRHPQVSAADLISVAGHSLEPHQTPLEGRYSRT